MTALSNFQRGFTLIEAIIVIIITGIMVGAVAFFLRVPFQSYMDMSRRGQMSDTADTALRRIARDLRIALPNSVRPMQVGTTTCLEMLQTRAGGRYRATQTAAGQGDILDFNNPAGDISFDMFGQFSNLPNQAPVRGDRVVVYNLGPASPGADAYAGDNSALIANFVFPDPTSPGESLITLTARKQFPLASPSNRFQVVSGPVTYVCAPGPLDALGNGTGTLNRVFNYPIAAAQSCPPVGGQSTPLANSVANCTINYTPAVQRNGVVQMQLQLEQSNEVVNMYHEAQVTNAP